MKIAVFWSKISQKFVPIDNNASLIGDKLSWCNDGLVYWHTYVSLGFNELTHWPLGDLDVILKM